MPKRSGRPAPSEEEIRAHSNVPYELAARYIGWSDISVRYALQQGRAPFGCAAQNPETGTWSYNISPGLLIRYKAGDLPYYRLNDIINLAAEGTQKVLDMRLAAAAKLLQGGLT